MRRGSLPPLGPVPDQIARMRELQALPFGNRTAKQSDELERLELAHYQRLNRLPIQIERLEKRLADLRAMAA